MACVLLGGGLLAAAMLVALAPTVNGDNYCGRVYFDTSTGPACADTMAVRRTWSVALAAAGSSVLMAVVSAARRPALAVAAVLGSIALAAVLVGFNRLLQPIPPRIAYCGSILNRIVLPDVAGHDDHCLALLRPYEQAGKAAFGVATATAVAGVGAVLWPRLRTTIGRPTGG